MWAQVDYSRNMTLIALMQQGKRKNIMAVASYAEVDAQIAEVAFLVQEELHGQGIATFMLNCLEEIARQNNYTSFSAIVLAENVKMIRVFKNSYPNIKIMRGESGEIEMTMPFDEAPDEPDATGDQARDLK